MIRTTRTLLAATTVVAGLAGSLLAAAPAEAANASGVVTANPSVTVRAKPTSNSTSFGTYKQGTKINILCKTTGQSVGGNRTWYSLPGEGPSYVSAKYVKVSGTVRDCKGDSTPTAKAAVKATLRTAPSTKDSVVRTVKAGTKITVVCSAYDQDSVDWFRTTDGNWVLGSQLSGLVENAVNGRPGPCA